MKLNTYDVRLVLRMVADSRKDAIELATDAIDASRILDRRGVVDVVYMDDPDGFEMELDDYEYGYDYEEDSGEPELDKY